MFYGGACALIPHSGGSNRCLSAAGLMLHTNLMRF